MGGLKRYVQADFGMIDKDRSSEWGGMPEFVQDDMSPAVSVTIHFRNEQDADDFFALIGQRRTKRKSYWHPEAVWRTVADKAYFES